MSIDGERASAAHSNTPDAAPSSASVAERASPPVELCERLQAVWRRQPLDRRAALEALVSCARWLRDAGLPPEAVLLGIKQLLPVDAASPMERLASLDERSVLLRLTLTVFHGDDDPESLLAQWPDVDRRAGRPHPAREHARVVRDTAGEDWMVYERVDRRARRARARSLVFESERCMRRIHDYPPTWRDLSRRDLLRLVEPWVSP